MNMFKKIAKNFFLSLFLALLIGLPVLAQMGGGGFSGGFWKLSGSTLSPVNPSWTVDGVGGAPSDAKYITQTANGDLSAEQALSALSTGIVKNTTGTGVLSIAAAGTDYISPSNTATTSTAGISELATAAEITTGTDNTRTITPLGLAGSDIGKRGQPVMVLDVTENCTTGDGAGDVAIRIPSLFNGWNLVGVEFGVTTAGTTGNMDVQVRNATQAADMLSTKMRVETGETDTITSAQPGTIDTNNDDVATGDQIYFDIDSCQTTPALGLLAILIFQKP